MYNMCRWDCTCVYVFDYKKTGEIPPPPPPPLGETLHVNVNKDQKPRKPDVEEQLTTNLGEYVWCELFI